MTDDPKCLIAVPTFKRTHFLPRILACFHRLDYENKHMVILNDDKDCKITITPNEKITVLNLDTQLNLSVKRNMISTWDYDILFPLDDDDLFLPNRLKNHVEFYKSNPLIDWYRNKVSINIYNKVIKKGQGGAFTNSSITRQGFFKTGGYKNFNRSTGEDLTLRTDVFKHCKVRREENWDKCDFVFSLDHRIHNSSNDEPIMDNDRINKLNMFTQTGDVFIEPDFQNYDNIVAISEEIIKTGNDIKIELERNGSVIKRL